MKKFIGLIFFIVLLAVSACQAAPEPVLPTLPPPELSINTATPLPPTVTPFPTQTPAPPTATAEVAQAPTALPELVIQPTPGGNGHPTLADFWEGTADFRVDVPITGLPLGESETIRMSNGELWSYLHASHQSAGVVDRCGDPVEFPGCTVIYRSYDDGDTFSLEDPTCQFHCDSCPCDPQIDQQHMQQYPRVFYDGELLHLVNEFFGKNMYRISHDGLNFSSARQVSDTGPWYFWYAPCPDAQLIGEHPFVPFDYECLAGGPPGIWLEGETIYSFLAVGQSPGGMGCYKGQKGADPSTFEACDNNPLFKGAQEYGSTEIYGPDAQPWWDFRTISSADVQQIGDRYYMVFEGIRGAGPGDGGDSQFGLGIARSTTDQIDGPWEKFAGNPIIIDLPGNVGLGHADLLVLDGQTIMYTSLDGATRSKLVLEWVDGAGE